MSARDPDDTREYCDRNNIHRCPLYIASHDVYGLGCVDDMAEPCRVARGELSYHAALNRLISASFSRMRSALLPVQEGKCILDK